jgi:hypothetical protein
MHSHDFHRFLEAVCRKQAAQASTEKTRREREMMAEEYRILAELEERRRREQTVKAAPNDGQVRQT